jgi:hypothetical protein
MFCRQCGKENAETDTTCVYCGAPLVTTNPYAAGPFRQPSMMTGPKPDNNLVGAILVTLCCCLPFGIASIVYAAQVDSKWNLGDHAGAVYAADQAKKFMWIGFGLGILANAVIWGIQIVGVLAQIN